MKPAPKFGPLTGAELPSAIYANDQCLVFLAANFSDVAIARTVDGFEIQGRSPGFVNTIAVNVEVSQ